MIFMCYIEVNIALEMNKHNSLPNIDIATILKIIMSYII